MHSMALLSRIKIRQQPNILNLFCYIVGIIKIWLSPNVKKSNGTKCPFKIKHKINSYTLAYYNVAI